MSLSTTCKQSIIYITAWYFPYPPEFYLPFYDRIKGTNFPPDSDLKLALRLMVVPLFLKMLYAFATPFLILRLRKMARKLLSQA